MDAGIHGTQTPCLLVQLTDGQANWFTDVQLININWRLTTDVYLQVATNYFLFSSWLYSGVDFNNKVTIIRAGDKWSTKIHCTCSDLGFTAAKCWQDYFPAFFGFLFVWFFFFPQEMYRSCVLKHISDILTCAFRAVLIRTASFFVLRFLWGGEGRETGRENGIFSSSKI